MKTPAEDPEALLTYDGFVRGLARHLVFDAHSAEDVAQQAWVAALEDGPRDRSSLRTWLASLVRNLSTRLIRTESARGRRERAAAREEAIPSAAEILERESARQSVVRAVLALDEPYRSTVLLRYFEHLPPREIARRLAVPVETVRTRCKRALQQLRGRLDHDYGGDRRAWSAVLLPLADLPPLPLAPLSPLALAKAGSSFIGVLFMSLQSKIAIAAVLIACSGLALWQLAPGSGPEVSPGAQPLDEASAMHATQRDPRAAEPETAPRREVASAAAPKTRGSETTGSLFVRILWGSDKTPAAHVAAWVTPSWQVNPVLDRILVESRDDGTFLIPSIRAGIAMVQVLRGGEKSIEVGAGTQTEVTVEIPSGFVVTGEVVRSDGRPAGGAEIWLSRGERFLLAGQVVGHCAADGSFRLRDVANPSYIGAIGPGRARSPLVAVSFRREPEPSQELHVRLTLREAMGEVAGRVLDPGGSPVAGAFVRMGTDHVTVIKEDNEVAMHKGGSFVTASPAMEVKTDAAGGFHFGALTPDRREIAVRAKSFAPWTRMVEVGASGCTTLEVRLSRGVTLVGTVTTSAGEPVPDAEVATGYHEVIASSLARTDAQGAFRIEALAPGRIEVEARTKELGRARTVLTAPDGQEVRWDATLAAGLELRGRVLDHLDAPLPDWTVQIQAEVAPPSGIRSFGKTRTDHEGRFRIPNCADLPHRVEFRDQSPFPVDARSGVRPGDAELTFRISAESRATAHITGVVVDAEDRPQGDASLWLYRSRAGIDNRTDSMTEGQTGRFRLGPLSPGRYRLRYSQKSDSASNRIIPSFFTEERELAAGETLDLGTLRILPGGTLRVTAKDEAGAAVSGVGASLLVADGSQNVDSMSFEGGLVRWIWAASDGDRVLAPGSYQILVGGKGFAFTRHALEIRAGSETRVDLVLRRGIPRTLVIEDTALASPTILARLVVLDAEGKPVSDSAFFFPRGTTPVTRSAWFLPGTYRARATMEGRVGEVGFRVEPGVTGDETVRIVLK